MTAVARTAVVHDAAPLGPLSAQLGHAERDTERPLHVESCRSCAPFRRGGIRPLRRFVETLRNACSGRSSPVQWPFGNCRYQLNTAHSGVAEKASNPLRLSKK